MIVPGNFGDFYGTTMLPALRSVIDRGYRARPTKYTQVFNINPSSRSIEQFSQVSGVGRFSQLAIGGKIRYDQPVQGFKSTFKHVRFGLAVPTTIDVVEDDEWQLVENMHRDLGWSCNETRELDAVGTFNNGFSGSFLGPDGVALFSASHPLYKAGGLQSNLMTAADLDSYSLQLALTVFELMKRPSGELIHIKPSKLIVAPANRFIAYALTKSTDDPTTADRSVNPLLGAEDGMPTTFVWPYLTSPNAWFLAAEPQDTGLVWFDRKKPYTKSWTDDETEVGIVGMRYKKSHGWNNYIGLVGNQGL
jgi:hypothetical protein